MISVFSVVIKIAQPGNKNPADPTAEGDDVRMHFLLSYFFLSCHNLISLTEELSHAKSEQKPS